MSVNPARAVSAVLAIAGTVAVVGVGAPLAHAANGVPVTLVVDGASQDVTTQAATVADLLTEQSINTDSHDRVVPGTDTTITADETVTVDHTQPVTVVEWGQPITRYVAADTLGAATAELGYATVTAAKSTPLADRKFLHITYSAPDGSALTAGTAVAPNDTIDVQHVAINATTLRQSIARATRKHLTPLIPAGDSTVVRRGHAGVRTMIRLVRRVDGTVVSRRIALRTVSRPMRPRLLRVGTGPNWYALANCESGGNPNAVNSAGYYGLYQFSSSTWHSVGGKGLPTDYGQREQTYRAWLLYQRSGSAPWPVCGRLL